ncbi:uncharacterized protein [Heterodontus francisci]|uniref:uncharacterized protein n=1 Tax=Heterodontus francisci TaxID=7792 RepID=UPI00355C674E
MVMNGLLCGICFLGIMYPVAVDSSGNATPDIIPKKVLRGTNVVLRCPFSFNLNHSNVIVYWWRDGNKTFLQEDSRKLFSVKRGGAYLHLLNVTVPDAGTYYCVTKYQYHTVGETTGVQLVVYATPAPLKILSPPSEGVTCVPTSLQCRTSAFYPKDFNLSWHINGTELLTGFTNVQQTKTPEGLFEVISSLKVSQAIDRGTVYTCQLHHVSNLIPANASYTFSNEDCASKIDYVVIAGCAGGALVVLVLAIMIVKGLLFIISKGGKRTSLNTSQHADRKEREASEDKLMNASLFVVGSREREIPKQHEESREYAEAKQSTTDSNLTYLALNLTGSTKTAKSKHKETSLVYAAVKNSN